MYLPQNNVELSLISSMLIFKLTFYSEVMLFSPEWIQTLDGKETNS